MNHSGNGTVRLGIRDPLGELRGGKMGKPFTQKIDESQLIKLFLLGMSFFCLYITLLLNGKSYIHSKNN
jgi:hypothetical protein